MLVTLVLARVLAEQGAPPDVVEDAILLVKRTAQVGEICDSPTTPDGPDGGLPDGGVSDGGVPDGGVPDGGVLDGSGLDGSVSGGGVLDGDGLDGGVSDGGAWDGGGFDGGMPGGGLDGGVPDGGVPDGGVPDGGVPDGGAGDGGLVCVPVNGDVISLVTQPRFALADGGGRFALLFVTPGFPVVQTYAPNVFAELAAVTQPRVEVRRIEIPDPAYGKACDLGGGCNFAPTEPPPSWDPSFTDASVPGDGGGGPPGVEAVGPYEVVRARPASPAELAGWLDDLGYVYQQEDLDATAPYIARGYTVVALRVAVDDTAALAPIALTWQGSTLTLPAAFGAATNTVTRVYIAGDQRYELDDAFVAFAARTGWGETAWLTRNDVVLASDSPAADPVASARGTLEDIPVEVVYQEVHVPVSDCGDVGCCGDCNTTGGPSPTSVGGSLAVLILIGRRRRPRRR